MAFIVLVLGAVAAWRLGADAGDEPMATYVPRSTTTAVAEVSDGPAGVGGGESSPATTTTTSAGTSPATVPGSVASTPPVRAPAPAAADPDPQSRATTTTAGGEPSAPFDPTTPPVGRSSGIEGGTTS